MGCCESKSKSKTSRKMNEDPLDYQLRTKVIKENLPEEQIESILNDHKEKILKSHHVGLQSKLIDEGKPIDEQSFKEIVHLSNQESQVNFKKLFLSEPGLNVPYIQIHQGLSDLNAKMIASEPYYRYYVDLYSHELCEQIKTELVHEIFNQGTVDLDQYDNRAKGTYFRTHKDQLIDCVNHYNTEIDKSTTLFKLKAQHLSHTLFFKEYKNKTDALALTLHLVPAENPSTDNSQGIAPLLEKKLPAPPPPMPMDYQFKTDKNLSTHQAVSFVGRYSEGALSFIDELKLAVKKRRLDCVLYLNDGSVLEDQGEE